jgi:uncharacterized protein YaaN involved in tellurite resistance
MSETPSPFKKSPFQTGGLPSQEPKPTQSLAVQDITPRNQVSSPFSSNTPMVSTAMVQIKPIVTDEQVEGVTSHVSTEVTKTTERLINSMTLNRFGELGEMLVNFQVAADSLDISKVKEPGLVGWLKSKVIDVQKALRLRFETAKQAFDDFEKKATDQIALHREWIKNLELLYTDNFEEYQRVVEAMKTLEGWEHSLSSQVTNWPVIAATDPNGAMKLQAKSDAEGTLNRLQIQRDMMLRLKEICENNGVKIRVQQDTSRTVIQNLTTEVVQVLPLIKMQFVTYLQSSDVMAALGTFNAGTEMANTSLQKSSEATKQAALSSAKALNTPIIANTTLDSIRESMLNTISGVKQIQQAAQQQRIADAQSLADNQAKYLTQLQSQGVV